ncbi:MAG: hypothetical protein M3Y68_03065 [Chloroflexota bacterium]|nr:hypothetical protein [Chloroflexota bacterium]
MKVKFFLIGASILLTVILAACEGEPTPVVEPVEPEATVAPATIPPASPLQGYEDLVNSLQAAGATVEPGEGVEQPFFSVPGQTIQVNDQAVQVYVYESAEALEAEAAEISEDGSSIGTTMVNWEQPPHFFKSGRVLALYLGEDPNILNLLGSVLNPEFAGIPN